MDDKKLDPQAQDEKARKLYARLEELAALEAKIRRREQDLQDRENAKRKVLLRLPPKLYEDIARLAELEFRSVNGEIECLLTEAVSKRIKPEYEIEL